MFFSLSKTHQKHEFASPLLKHVLEQRQRNILRSFSKEGRYDSLGVHHLEYPVLSSNFELFFSNVHHLSDTGMFWQVPPVSREW